MTTATGRRAYVSFVDDDYLPGFVALLKSLHLTTPTTSAELVVLHDGLDPANVARIVSLRPDVRFVAVDTAPYESYRKGDESNYLYTKAYYILDAFRLSDYDRIVTLDTDMVLTAPVEDLFDHPASFAAVPQLLDSDGGRKLNSGLLVIGRQYLTGEFADRLDAIGRSGDYELDRHDQGVLTAALDGDYARLERTDNWVKRATAPGSRPPSRARVLHFTGRHKPWHGGEQGYAPMEREWHRFAVSDVAYHCRLVAAAERAGVTADDAGAHVARSRELVAALPAELRSWLCEHDPSTGELLEVARSRSARGDFAAAVAIRSLVALERGRVDDPVRCAADLRAVGRLDEARAVATLAAQGNESAQGRSFLAETAWVLGDLDAARAHVAAALSREPAHVRARALQRRLAWDRPDARVASTTSEDGLRLAHAAFYVDELGNFGDELLPVAVRESVAAQRAVESWTGLHVHQHVDASVVERVNATDALLVGGGGLFLPDTMPNAHSGWQWNIPDASLDALRVPLALVAVGYNLFDGQEVHGSRFAQSLRKTVETAATVGLRNHGSIDRVRSMLPAELAEKVVYTPCPTTFLGLLDHGPGAGIVRRPRPEGRPVVYLNIAYDRSALRFGGGYPEFLAEIDALLGDLDDGYEARVAAHTVGDERIAQDLYAHHGRRVAVDAFFRMGVERALQAYADAAVVVGMRGHAGMIPFGVGTPILSLISHPKLRYFLQDVGHTEWGVSVDSPHLAARLGEKVRDVVEHPDGYRTAVDDGRRMLRDRYDEALGKFLTAL